MIPGGKIGGCQCDWTGVEWELEESRDVPSKQETSYDLQNKREERVNTY